MTERYICIHGHYYQPPRENPWLEEIELQDSAYPYHDWNERITAECYGPNTESRILDDEDRIVDIVNNYSKMSFNFGPTLLAWLERHAPDTYQAVLQADRLSAKRFGGHGSAMAQAYNHMILPLASLRDVRTQVRWGIRDFQARFRRMPEGMWLPETAVDTTSLEVLAEEGILFTVLAPRQAARVRPLDDEDAEWTDVSQGKVDPSMAYQVNLPSGRTIVVFFYDGPISQAVAFEGLLSSGERFARRLETAFDDSRDRAQLSHIATDGETYGHHHRHGDMALSYALRHIETSSSARLTNYGEFLALHPPTHEAEIVGNTSWSCVHGVERWQNDCGCRTGSKRGWNQAWRRPLRDALDNLRDRLGPHYQRAAGELLQDPWAARDAYVDVVLDRSPDNVQTFLKAHAKQDLDHAATVRVLRLLEMQRHAMLMYTSCGWFFDEISGIEALQILHYAGRAIQLGEQVLEVPLEESFLDILEEAPSNEPDWEDGRDLYERQVRPNRVNLLKVGAHYALSWIHGERDEKERDRVYCYQVDRQDLRLQTSGRLRLVVGRVTVTSTITLSTAQQAFAVIHFGDHNVSGGVRLFRGETSYEEMVAAMTDAFDQGDVTRTLKLVGDSLDETITNLGSLFRDEQRRILDWLLATTVAEAVDVYREVFDDNAPLMRFLASLDVPSPEALSTAARIVLNEDLREAAAKVPLDPDELNRLLDQARRHQVVVDHTGVAFELSRSLETMAQLLQEKPTDINRLGLIESAVGFVRGLPATFDVDLTRPQTIFFSLIRNLYPKLLVKAEAGDEDAAGWVASFENLGERLGVAIPE